MDTMMLIEPAQIVSSVPPIFDGCISIFKPGIDDKYANCNISNPDEACRLLGKLHQVKEFRTYFLAIIPIVLSVFAFLSNLFFLFLQWMVWRKAGSGHRKRYALILFRSVTSLLTLICFYGLLIVWKVGGFNYASVAVFIFIGSHDFFCIASTYLALTVILYTAVVHPIFYKVSFRLMHSYILIACIYVVTMLASVCFGLFEATLFYPDTTPIPCPLNTCGYPVSIIIVVLLSLGTATVVTLYTVLMLRMRIRTRQALHSSSVKSNESSKSSKKSSEKAMNRMAFNMVTFAISSLPILAIAIYALVELEELAYLGEGDKSPCKTFLNSDLFVEVELLASAAAMIWVLSMVIDPIANTLADPRLVQEVKQLWTKISSKCCNKTS